MACFTDLLDLDNGPFLTGEVDVGVVNVSNDIAFTKMIQHCET